MNAENRCLMRSVLANDGPATELSQDVLWGGAWPIACKWCLFLMDPFECLRCSLLVEMTALCGLIYTHTQTHTDTHRHTQTHTDTHRHTQTHTDTHTDTHTRALCVLIWRWS